MTALYAKPDPHYRFVPDPGTDFTHGVEPQIAERLNELAQLIHQNIYGISGYRTPQHSVDVHGFANDPHTRGQAADIGVGNSLRASAAGLTEADLEKVGLTRPFGGASEINHVQLLNPRSSSSPSTADTLLGSTVNSAGPAGPVIAAVGGLFGAGPDKPIAHAEQTAVSDAAQATAQAVVDLASTAVGKQAGRWSLYGVLVIGGIAMMVIGASRALGLRQGTNA